MTPAEVLAAVAKKDPRYAGLAVALPDPAPESADRGAGVVGFVIEGDRPGESVAGIARRDAVGGWAAGGQLADGRWWAFRSEPGGWVQARIREAGPLPWDVDQRAEYDPATELFVAERSGVRVVFTRPG